MLTYQIGNLIDVGHKAFGIFDVDINQYVCTHLIDTQSSDLNTQLFAYSPASFADQSPFGFLSIASHQALLPTSGAQPARNVTAAANTMGITFFILYPLLNTRQNIPNPIWLHPLGGARSANRSLFSRPCNNEPDKLNERLKQHYHQPSKQNDEAFLQRTQTGQELKQSIHNKH